MKLMELLRTTFLVIFQFLTETSKRLPEQRSFQRKKIFITGNSDINAPYQNLEISRLEDDTLIN
jgi:UDP-N-acetylglucosamine 2-epimerase